MKKSFIHRTILSVVVLSLVTSTAAADVRDHAGMFSKNAIDGANGQIDLLKQKRKKDLVVETFKTVPDEKREEIKGVNAQAKDEFYAKWAAERARQLELDGVYVLITQEPSYIYVAAGPETRKKAFTSENATSLRKLIVERFKAKQYDRGLLEGVSFARETVKGNVKDAANPDQREVGGFTWKGLLCTAVIALGVIWLVMALVRGFSGAGAAGGAGSALGGGGFMSGMLGGLFGAVAGNWLYHSMFGGHSGGWGGSSANADDAQGGDLGASDEGRDFTGSGGDYGDSGGDAGGGGDWGGGGGDWGGGGDY